MLDGVVVALVVVVVLARVVLVVMIVMLVELSLTKVAVVGVPGKLLTGVGKALDRTPRKSIMLRRASIGFSMLVTVAWFGWGCLEKASMFVFCVVRDY